MTIDRSPRMIAGAFVNLSPSAFTNWRPKMNVPPGRRSRAVARLVGLGAMAIFLATADDNGPKKDSLWAPVEFLAGDWIGEGGASGRRIEAFSFQWDLHQKILVRKSNAAYPATTEQRAHSHRDMMILYKPSEGNHLRAIYFDTEGHSLHYEVIPAPDGNAVEFLSDVTPANPRFRFTYRKIGKGVVAMKIEIANSGKPNEFTTYLEGRALRKPGSRLVVEQ